MPNNDVRTELQNLKEKVNDLVEKNRPDTFLFPLKIVEEALKFDKDFKANRFSMKSLVHIF